MPLLCFRKEGIPIDNHLIFHIDVNSAFLSWSAVEKLKTDPSLDLRTIPSIIGGDEKSRHGVVLAKSIPAKKYGVQTGEPVANALRKCPFLVMEPPDHKLYSRRSRELMELLNSYTPDLEQVSVDECFLFYTPISHLFPSPEAAARQIADRVRDTLGFTVNVGIAPNKLLAKMASDFEKPDRVHTLYMEEIPQKMWPLSVRDLFMVGKSSAARLEELGIHTIGELAHTDPSFLQAQFKSQGLSMWKHANGYGDTTVNTERQEAKGIGNSTTLSKDVKSAPEAKHILLKLAEQVSARLRKARQLASTVTVEIKYNDFRVSSRQMQLSTPVSTSNALYRCACHLFDELWSGVPIRLLGLRTTKLQSEDDPIQLSLFGGDFPLLESAPTQKTDTRQADAKSPKMPPQQISTESTYLSAATAGAFSDHKPQTAATGTTSDHKPQTTATGTISGHEPQSETAKFTADSGQKYCGKTNDTTGDTVSASQRSSTASDTTNDPRRNRTANETANCSASGSTATQKLLSTDKAPPENRPLHRELPLPAPSDQEKQLRLDHAIDQIRKKYGENAVVRGSFLKPRR